VGAAVRAQGQWLISSKSDRAPGIGDVFLLDQSNVGWPPEVDIAEGSAGHPRMMSVPHHDANNKQVIST